MRMGSALLRRVYWAKMIFGVKVHEKTSLLEKHKSCSISVYPA